MENRFYFFINGFSFECAEESVSDFLSCFDSCHRCIGKKGLHGKEILGSVQDVKEWIEMYF